MARTTNYVNLKTSEASRRRAAVTKAKLGMTWSEFIQRAANELDPDEETDD